MRKCPYCSMVSHDSENCDWCRRPFDQFFDMRVMAAKPVPVKKEIPKPVKVVASGIAIALAIYSLAHIRTSPDAANLVEPHTVSSVVNGHIPGNTNNTLAAPAQPQAAAPTATPMASPLASNSASASSNLGSGDSSSAPAEKISAHLTSVHITTRKQADGNETAVGTVIIVNDSPFEISDFTLSLEVGGVPSVLSPFEGASTYPMALRSTHVPPHGNLQVSVMSAQPFNSQEGSARTVHLDARFESGQTVSDVVPLAAG